MIKGKRKQGFSLAEICVVCGILLVFLVPVFTLMSRSSSGTIKNRNEILAQMHATNVIAFCNAVPYDDPFLVPTDGKDVVDLKINAGSNKIDLDPEEGSIFKRVISIKEYKGADWPFEYKLVVVKIEWKQPGEAKSRCTQMSGIITKS